MKYIMFTVPLDATLVKKIPVMFPTDLSHRDVAEALKNGCPELKKATVTSAGEYTASFCQTGGRSSTLRLDAKEEDAHLIETHDYFHGLESVGGDDD